jgi:uridine phosphorylase
VTTQSKKNNFMLEWLDRKTLITAGVSAATTLGALYLYKLLCKHEQRILQVRSTSPRPELEPAALKQSNLGTIKEDLKRGEQMKNANFPTTEEGRTYHVGTKRGEVMHRIVIVGDLTRAEMYADMYLDNKNFFKHLSTRGFLTCSGTYKGVPVSIVGTGMGIAMIDFSIREIRALFPEDEQIAFIRVGTCGTPHPDIPAGTVIVNDSSILISRNPDAFRKGSNEEPYRLSKPVKSDPVLTNKLKEKISAIIGSENVRTGLNATADSFYSSQGRIDTNFDDRNKELIEKNLSQCDVYSLEMETFHLFDMAEVSKGTIIASSALIVLAQRTTGYFIDLSLKQQREKEAGKAALDAIIEVKLQHEK